MILQEYSMSLTKGFFFTLATLLPFLNPPAIAPIFLAVTENLSPETRLILAKKISINIVLMLTAVVLIGSTILNFFGISLSIVKIGGGLLIAYSAWKLVNSNEQEKLSHENNKEELSKDQIQALSFYPLTFPITCGPGAIAGSITIGVTILSNNTYSFIPSLLGIISGITLAAISLYICMKFAAQLLDKLGKSGTAVFIKISSFIMLCLGIQVSWDGLKDVVSAMLLSIS
ncbi:hypothetical protein CKSOR_00301 [Candidatus Kinetoplastibacterium sorsogonicusi]|uniref:UPF0056 membrane protein n=1 Tax=Candidatus Kinetoplastidibacterium kentomonadis TaxID=1576550 RepID=A0A3Q8EU51_9PROT|nr:MarC family protein [Candidatus Kinetoplastibacterium sorsogonicusi]AWD32422.1 hypothetical protein CKSOR_00301 [Candidatus Kinetoplastibacterium sorsogonicusi]